MKTTLDLPDGVMRAVKIRAVEENLLRRGLACGPGGSMPIRRRV